MTTRCTIVLFTCIICVWANIEDIDDLSDFSFKSPIDDVTELSNYENSYDIQDKYLKSITDDDYKRKNDIKMKEKLFKSTIINALTNKELRRKFVEVIPIIRALSQPQRIALSALISAQVNSKPGQEFKLDQVQSLFGHDKKLLIPLIFDIANLVRTASKSSIQFPFKTSQHEQNLMIRRYFDLGITEPDSEELPENLNAKMINDALYSANDDTTYNESQQRYKRDLTQGFNQSEDFEGTTVNRTSKKINNNDGASNYQSDNITLYYHDIEDLAFKDLNGTVDSQVIEKLPAPEGLKYYQRRIPSSALYNANRRAKPPGRITNRSRRPQASQKNRKKCEKFTHSMCLHIDDYPMEKIMASIRRHRHAMSALLAEYRDTEKVQEFDDDVYESDLLRRSFATHRREDDNVGTTDICSSISKYARPQKALSASGEWKFIVNTGEHTQTIRLEKCSTPQSSCSYLATPYQSKCVQIYDYHRLLSWDDTRGLHVDIFKVPTCCTCHVKSYSDNYPPLSNKFSPNSIHETQPKKHNNKYKNVVDDESYETNDDDGDETGYDQYSSREKPIKVRESSRQHSSTRSRSKGSSKHTTRSPTREHHSSPISTGSSKIRIRRPSSKIYHYETDDRLDQDISGSDILDVVKVRPYQRPTDNTGRQNIKQKPHFSLTNAIPVTASTINKDTKLFSDNSDGLERINYNYHPIIDYFYVNQKPGAEKRSEKVHHVRLNNKDDWKPIIA